MHADVEFAGGRPREAIGGGRPGAAEPAREAPTAGFLAGDLSCLPAFELLQVLHYLGKSGRLSLRRRPGDEARCGVVPRGLIDPECGALREREAALAFSWWKEGSFRFEPCAPGAAAAHRPALPVQEVLLEAVRLADEIEARAALVPERGEPLALLRRDALAPGLLRLPSAPEIVRFLGERPGATRRDLEAALPFAPVTLGFALARLCEEGRVAPHQRRLPDGAPPRRASPAGADGGPPEAGRALLPLLDGGRVQGSTPGPAPKPDPG